MAKSSSKTAATGKQYEKGVSLHPLTFEQAVQGLLKVKVASKKKAAKSKGKV